MLFEDQIQLVDPITRETHPAANLRNFTDRITNQKSLPVRHGSRRLAVYTNNWHRAPGQTFSVGTYTRLTRRIAFVSWTSTCKNAHWKQTQQFLGQNFSQRFYSQCLEKVFAKTHCFFKQQQGLWQFPFLCCLNRHLCGHNDLAWILQRPIYGYVWTNCICSGTTLRHLFLHFFSFLKTHHRCCG